MRFGVMGKLRPRYIRSYFIVQHVKEVAYRLELPAELPRVYNIFHVSHLPKCVPTPSHVITLDPIQSRKDLSYEE